MILSKKLCWISSCSCSNPRKIHELPHWFPLLPSSYHFSQALQFFSLSKTSLPPNSHASFFFRQSSNLPPASSHVLSFHVSFYRLSAQIIISSISFQSSPSPTTPLLHYFNDHHGLVASLPHVSCTKLESILHSK